MTPTLLHYPASPFAELVRVAFGIKRLAWQSLEVPNMMPKPDQTELTGGYGRTPVLAIGADVFCDTAAIIDALEALPGPSLYPAPLGALHRVVAGWAAGPQFVAHVGAAMGNLPPGALPPAFVADRKSRFGFDIAQLSRAAPHLTGQAMVAAHWLSAILADGRAFIGGAAAGHGDLALHANVWFIRSVPFAADTAAAVLALPQVADWYARMVGIGHGERTEIDGPAALATARDTQPARGGGTVDAPFEVGQSVVVKSDGSADTPVAGRLLRYDASGITVQRHSAACGTLAVHFPRLGQMVVAA